MKISTIYKITGYLSVIIGVLAALCIYKIQLMFYGIGFALLGFILGGINVFLNSKYFYDQEKYPKGYIGIFLSSVPILFMLFVIFRYKH